MDNIASRILIIDDDPALTQALSVRLRRAGFDVITVNSAIDGSSAVVHVHPDLIILDVDMPSFSGLEFHQCLRFARRASEAPVVYLSGYDSDTNRRIAFEQGAVAFMAKPYDAERLISTVNAALGTAP